MSHKQVEDKSKKSVDKKPKAKKKDTEQRRKGMVVIPYVNGVSERIQRIFKKHKVDTAMKPHKTLRQTLVHPKDKRDTLKTGNCIYEIDCKNCDLSYVGETSRMFDFRLEEHKKEAKKASKKPYTRSERRASEQEQTKSAISDHVARANHVIDWKNHKILGKEQNKKAREIREAMEIRKRGDKTMNREEGTYFLSHVYDSLLTTGKKTKRNIDRIDQMKVSRESGSPDQI